MDDDDNGMRQLCLGGIGFELGKDITCVSFSCIMHLKTLKYPYSNFGNIFCLLFNTSSPTQQDSL